MAELKSSRVPAGQRPPGRIAINYCIVHYVLCTTGRLARKLPLARQQQHSQPTTFTHVIQTCRITIRTTTTTTTTTSTRLSDDWPTQLTCYRWYKLKNAQNFCREIFKINMATSSCNISPTPKRGKELLQSGCVA